jgi:hypothetical protein
VVASWHRQLLKTAVAPLIAAREPRLTVTVSRFYARQMKITRTHARAEVPGAEGRFMPHSRDT